MALKVSNVDISTRDTAMTFDAPKTGQIWRSGAVDMALLNILIKTGFIGLVGYALAFARPIRMAIQSKNRSCIVSVISIVMPLVVSMFSENRVSRISISYIALSCLALSGLCGLAHKEMERE